MSEESASRVWAYPTWLRAGLAAMLGSSLYAAFTVSWPGYLKIYGYGTPILVAWASLEAWRHRLTMTRTDLVTRDMLGNERRMPLDRIERIVFGWRPALTIVDRDGAMIEVPRLFGRPRPIAETIAAAVASHGVRIERDR